jgi:hypothetical protein
MREKTKDLRGNLLEKREKTTETRGSPTPKQYTKSSKEYNFSL